MSLVFGALADDITGGMELAALLARQGVRCAFLTDWRLVERVRHEVDAIVLAQKTRVIPAAQAQDAFAQGWDALTPARQIFYKYCATFDSTAAGNIGPCADVLMDKTGAEFTLFCPTFPEARRFVFQGHLFVGDRLVSESPKRYDPVTPMLDPDLVRVLQAQTQRRVGLLPLEILQAGQGALRIEALKKAGVRHAIADALSEADLTSIAALCAEWPLMTGGSSVAEHLPQHWRRKGWIAPEPFVPVLPMVEGYGAVLAGSCSEVTLRQLDHFAAHRPVLTIDITAGEEEALIASARRWALPLLTQGPVAIATSASPERVAQAQAHFGLQGSAARAERILAALAVLLREAGVRRFVIAGGETSGTILDRLGVRQMHVGIYEEAGVARAVSASAPLLGLCLKSGKLGPPDMFLRMLDRMLLGEG